jgi:hypothetical protein
LHEVGDDSSDKVLFACKMLVNGFLADTEPGRDVFDTRSHEAAFNKQGASIDNDLLF